MKEKPIFAFVLMPFDTSFNDLYKFGIKETAEKVNILAERVDEKLFAEGIIERVYRQIDIADIVIADMTGKNPNVFYEVGYAHAKKKLTILLTSNIEDIPFDLKNRRHIVYGGSIQILSDHLLKELEWAKGEIENVRISRVMISMKEISGDLEKTQWTATANITFVFDLHNQSNAPSNEIEAIYFYSTRSWVVYQDGKECPSTQSDIDGFEIRHFLKPPIRKLPKGSWGQLKFDSKKTIAMAIKGEELKNSYRIGGRTILRMVTSEGNFDYAFTIDVMAEALPF